MIGRTNEKAGEEVATIRQLECGTVVVAVVDEVQRRVHQLVSTSSDIMFVDATGSLDRCNHQVLHQILLAQKSQVRLNLFRW